MTDYKPNLRQFAGASALRTIRHRQSILIIEDQVFFQTLLKHIISDNYDILSAADGIEGLKLYESVAPNIVFLDIDLPKMMGHQVLKHIQTLDKNCFVVMLTASQERDDVQQAIKGGACGYILKPFTKEQINYYLNFYQQNGPNTSG